MLVKNLCSRLIRCKILEALFLFIAILVGNSGAQPGALMHANTLANNLKSNQSRIWFYDGKWWTIALHTPSKVDYIWRHNPATGIWARTVAKLDSGASNRYDVVFDEGTGELAVLRSHTTDTKFYRFNYTAGVWSAALTKTLPGFGNADNNNPCTLVKAKNGDFWIFRIDAGSLQTRRSTNGGANWSVITNIKPGLNSARGTTAAVCFSRIEAGAAQNFVGVAYGEQGAIGVNTVYGFLYHRDGDAINIWTDETNLLDFQNDETGNNQLSLAVDPQNRLYLFTRNFGGTGNAQRNTLFKRLGAGVWKRIAVNAASGVNWNSPAVAIDTSNGLVIVAGIRNDNGLVEYKCALPGLEQALDVLQGKPLLAHGSDIFQHINLPRQFLDYQNAGMLITAGNSTENHTWFNHVFKEPIPPIIVNSVERSSNEVNASSRFGIPIVLTDPFGAALPAGFGKIFVRFSPATEVPDTVTLQHVRINGVAAASVIVQPNLQRLTITTPIDLAGDAAVFIEIDSSSGIINAKYAGDDSVRVWTNAQPISVCSPIFELIPAQTKVTPALVMPMPNNPGEAADYTIIFRLGAHGRMFAEEDTFYVQFPASTTITDGELTEVYVNDNAAYAEGDNVAHQIRVVLPAGLNLSNQDSVTIFLPAAALQNPPIVNNYTLSVATSVERNKTLSQPYAIGKIAGSLIPGTIGEFSRGNQSKTFYYGGRWWLAALASADNNWYLWKHNGVSWTKALLLHEAAKVRPDLLLNAAANKLYILFAGSSNGAELSRLTYTGNNWSVDAGYPKPVNNVQDDEMNLVRAKNGMLWVLWIADFKIYAQRSSNDGNTWFAPNVAKNNLNVDNGLSDAVAFTVNGANAIGVGYAESSSGQSARYGFVYHRDSDAGSVWTDETNKLIPPDGTSADNHISMATYNNQVFIIVKTNGGGVHVTKNALYLRRTNNTWGRFDIIKGDNGWTRPVIALDSDNQVLYVFGVVEGDTHHVEMKRVPFGQYGSLHSAPRETALCFADQSFFDISMPSHPVTANTNLMVVADNKTRDQLWHRLLTLGPVAKASAEEVEEPADADKIEDFAAAEVYPNPFNPRTAIRFHLTAAAPVRLQIFNIAGQLVRTLVDNELPAGIHQRHWNARNQNGEPVATGTYIYRLQIGERFMKGRMQLVK